MIYKSEALAPRLLLQVTGIVTRGSFVDEVVISNGESYSMRGTHAQGGISWNIDQNTRVWTKR